MVDPKPRVCNTYTPIVLNITSFLNTTFVLNTSLVFDEQNSTQLSAAGVLHRGSTEDALGICADEGEIERFEAGTEGAE